MWNPGNLGALQLISGFCLDSKGWSCRVSGEAVVRDSSSEMAEKIRTS